MTEVFFYHMTESRLEDALPDLLEKSLARGWRAVVQFSSEERRDALDHHLWIYRDESFLPHGTDVETTGALQPVLLTVAADQRANEPQVRFLVDGAIPAAEEGVASLEGYERAVYLFDGHDADQLQTARQRWKAERAAGNTVTYWQQNDDRRWAKRA